LTEITASENRVLRRIFEPKRDEVTGDCRKLKNMELHNFYSSLKRAVIWIIPGVPKLL
jgi:hypothetical protein